MVEFLSNFTVHSVPAGIFAFSVGSKNQKGGLTAAFGNAGVACLEGGTIFGSAASAIPPAKRSAVAARLTIFDTWLIVILLADVCVTSTQGPGPSPPHLLELLQELTGPLLDLRPLGGGGALGALPELGRLLLDRLDLGGRGRAPSRPVQVAAMAPRAKGSLYAIQLHGIVVLVRFGNLMLAISSDVNPILDVHPH